MTESLIKTGRVVQKMFQKVVKRISILVVACIFIASLHGKEASAASFTDIPAKYSEEINYLIDQKIINGYPDQTFRPNLSVTREEAVTMVGRALGYSGEPRQTSFLDVSPTSFASGYIEAAFENNLIAPNSEGNFRPKEMMTRGEMAQLLKGAFQLTENSLVTISDVNADGALYEAINAIITAGLSNGYPDGTFKPNNPMTRTEFSLFVARALNEDYRVLPQEEPDPETTATQAIVYASSLNVRSGPSTDHEIVGSLLNGTTVIVHTYEGDWAYVSTAETVGYVHRSYLIIPSLPGTGGKVVAIDAGHGGKDPGAIGHGLQEKEINLAISLKTQELLQQHGIEVVMTRIDDTFLELSERVNVAVQNNADTFVSIHTNANEKSSANGTETFFSTASLTPRAFHSQQLATFIQERLYQALETSNRGVNGEKGFHVIKKNPLPAVLVELAFISNSSDATKLGSEDYRNKAAEAIALGIVDYYDWKDAQSANF